jgi:hypothetical protein
MFCLRIGRVIAQRWAAEALDDEPGLFVASGTAHAFYEVRRWRGRADILGRSLAWIGHLMSIEFQRLNCIENKYIKVNSNCGSERYNGATGSSLRPYSYYGISFAKCNV